ncbi:ISL3 family transposase [Pseudarthrobacter albicanus]|uniref:ISL3 family transposase n=1 Tax=Pseudarthrobacter albicanus TaxID=2823873 RepID=UPI001BA7FF88|nr:ISL3 family transposase [Pseudarthrobacter albicanus]
MFPHLDRVLVERVRRVGGTVRVSARTRPDSAFPCPDCGALSRRAHSRYLRLIADTAVGGQPVAIEVSVRRLFCDEAGCPRCTFSEQVNGMTTRYGRRTPALVTMLQAVGLALAGRAGSRLTAVLGATVSRTTLLRLVMLLAAPTPAGAPNVLGVDDFALRKREVYGTVLVDCGSRRPIDLLPDRQSSTFAGWLREHPGAQVICRDRAGAYAEGARTGAPEAVQVADRWHLWHNLGEHVEKEVARHRLCLPGPGAQHVPDDRQRPSGEVGKAAADAHAASHVLSGRTHERYRRVHELLGQGASMQAAARELGLAYNTVRKYARADSADTLTATSWAHRRTILDAYKPYMHQRLSEGPASTAELHRQITARGYRGSYGTVLVYLRALRATGIVPSPGPAPPTARQVAGWIMSDPDTLGEDERARLKAVLANCPELESTTAHVRGFAAMLTELHGDRLRDWLGKVYIDTLPNLHSFANGIDRDRDAVIAGLTLPYSSGVVEGHINRIKMIKRQMFGRAGFQLLRQRVLLS